MDEGEEIERRMKHGLGPCPIRGSFQLSCVSYISWLPARRTSPPIAGCRRKQTVKGRNPMSILSPSYVRSVSVLCPSWVRPGFVLPHKTPRKRANSSCFHLREVFPPDVDL